MKNKIIAGCLILVGLIHLLPVMGVLGVAQLEKLYAVSIADPNLSILMRHRAVLFGLFGALMITAAFIPKLRLTTTLMGLGSVVSFIILAHWVGNPNPAIQRVILIDWFATTALIISLSLIVSKKSNTD